jgi:hypothetical protein
LGLVIVVVGTGVDPVTFRFQEPTSDQVRVRGTRVRVMTVQRHRMIERGSVTARRQLGQCRCDLGVPAIDRMEVAPTATGSATPMARLVAATPRRNSARSPGAHLPLVRALTIEAHAPPQGD